MSSSRYPSLAAVLEKRIAHGIYRDKLPTVRNLAAEFQVSKQTVTLALRPLIQSGLLKSDGRRGIRIASQETSSGIIAIVGKGDLSILETDRRLKELQAQINRDGFESILIGVTDWISSRNLCKLLGNHFSGIIFTNSTLSYEIAEYLDGAGIPFVSCNRLPVYPRINYVETNWAGTIRQIVRDFAGRGLRKMALFFHGRLEGYNVIVRKEWKKIKEECGLPLLPADRIRLDYSASTLDNLRRYLEILRGQKEYPELLIFWPGLDEEKLGLLTEGPLRVPASTRILACARIGVHYPEQVMTFSEGDCYHEILSAAYEALREVMIAPTTRKIHRSVEYPVIYNDFTNSKEEVRHVSNY